MCSREGVVVVGGFIRRYGVQRFTPSDSDCPVRPADLRLGCLCSIHLVMPTFTH